MLISNGQQTMGVSLPWAMSAALDARDPGRCVSRSCSSVCRELAWRGEGCSMGTMMLLVKRPASTAAETGAQWRRPGRGVAPGLEVARLPH